VSQPQHLYIHIPFCQRRCSYCDFNTYANMENRIGAYVSALCTELDMLGSMPNGSAAQSRASALLQPSIFFGGGTPSMLSLEQMERILQAADALVPLRNAEITIEANPGSVMGSGTSALDYLRGLRALGVNRLSLGVQSLHDPLLHVLGRTHSATEAQQCFLIARRAGFDNINLDVIFGLPGQSVEQWRQTLDTIVTWETDHFSLYSLILEEDTPLYAQVTGGRVHLPDDDTTASMYEQAIERLAAAGYIQYEISNWCRSEQHATLPTPAYACQHNLAYWFNSDYLAAGAGAHGHIYPQRYYDVAPIDNYIALVDSGQRPLAETIALAPRDLYAETMFMGLRLNSGVSRDHFRQRCGVDVASVFGPTLQDLQAQGLLTCDAEAVRLTPRGRMLGNRVFSAFVT
jgi:oxygen-independent coproporphyrinogen-3 oxidase